MKITDCKINHLSNPLGYELSAPRVSWHVEESTGSAPLWARLVVSGDPAFKNIIYDSGEVTEDLLYLPVKAELQPFTLYFYTVTVKSDAGEEAVSDICTFETARGNLPWAGKWITCCNNGDAAPLFSKEISPKSKVSSARLCITGLGLYEAFIGKERVGDELLAPYCNDYDRWIRYQTYDVTALLKENTVISVLLGNGWYKGRFGFRKKEGQTGFYGTDYMLLAELRIEYKDGTKEVIGTDGTWKVQETGILSNNIYDGETRDDTVFENTGLPFTVDKKEECARVLSEDEAPKAFVSPRYDLPIRVVKEFPAKLTVTPRGEKVFDIGQNISGIFRLRVRGKKGQKIRLQFGEVLQDGCFYRDNLRSAKAEYVYISDGNEKTLVPHFTFYGYRYINIEGYPDVKEEDITALACTTDLSETGKITCGHPLVQQLISNVNWGRRDNFLDVLTDCPQRDERMGWTGDAQVFSATASYLTDSYPFYRKYLHDMYLEQTHHNGGVPHTVPSFGMDAGSSVWGDAATIIPWNVYRFSGDKTIIREQYESMRSWVDFMTSADGEGAGWRRTFHYGDWLSLDVPHAAADQCFGATDVGFIADVYYMYSSELVADAAKMLGKKEDEETYRALSEKIRKRILDEYYSQNGRCCCDTQTGLVLSLIHGLGNREKAAERLKRKIEDNHGKLDCGFVGAPLLCITLSENGMSDIAAHLLLNEEYPGWLYEVKLGATTIWERWNSLDESGHISSTGMNSLNHYAYGSVLEWIFAYAAGLRPVEAGFTRTLIAPYPIKELGFLKCEYLSAAGLWKVSWEFGNDGAVLYKITVPFGAVAEVLLPGREKMRLKPGTYEF